jgi:hypothetical protein
LVIVLDIASPPRSTIEDADDMRRFMVRIDGGSDLDQVAAAFESTGLGTFENLERALVKVGAVRHLAAGKVGPEWEDGFAKMLAYAEGKGWVDTDAGTIAAHCEFGPAVS